MIVIMTGTDLSVAAKIGATVSRTACAFTGPERLKLVSGAHRKDIYSTVISKSCA